MEKPPPVWRVVVGGLIFTTIILGLLYGLVVEVLLSPSEFLILTALSVVAGPFVGAWFILATVRWTNRRGAPSRSKLPSDAP